MTITSRIPLVASILVMGAGLLTVTGAVADATRPNIIVIFTDDHGWTDLGAQGIRSDLRTPNLDALATGGLRMTNGYVTAPQCVPSRAGLLTGRYQNRFGVESNGDTLDGFDAQQTIAQRLKKAGYATGMSGKWHLGPGNEIPTHGFDDVYYHHGGPGGWANVDLDGKSMPGGAIKPTLYHLEANAAAACAFIRRHRDQPFFYYLAFRAPHVPLDPPKKYLDRFPGEMPERRRKALAMISAIDDGVGSLMTTLRELNLEERTLIFFMGDNGAPLKIRKADEPGGGPGWDGSLNEPMNGEKGMLTEGGIRVPFLVYWKGTITGGKTYEQPVISLDVAATANALAGLPDDPLLDGTNLLPYLTGAAKGAPHEAIFWRWIAQSAVREGKWKLLVGGARQYLFDLDADPYEKENLITQHPDIATRLRSTLQQWAGDLKPPGIETKSMAETWEKYFDFYLDGKTVETDTSATKADSPNGGLQGWVARNGDAAIADGALSIAPQKGKRPFIAHTGLKVAGPAVATIDLRIAKVGRAGIAWRLEGQKDFVHDQHVDIDVSVSNDWQQVQINIPAKGEIIHIRVMLPEGETDIRRISLRGEKEKQATEWVFVKPPQESPLSPEAKPPAAPQSRSKGK